MKMDGTERLNRLEMLQRSLLGRLDQVYNEFRPQFQKLNVVLGDSSTKIEKK